MPKLLLRIIYVIHAVSPVWFDGTKNEAELLESCYTKSLHLALEHKCESIAFPLLSTGNHGFPKDLALQIAIGAFSKFLMQHDMQIYLVVFSRNAYSLSEKLFNSVQSFIDEAYILEVSSPGLGRPLKKDKDFDRSMGKEVELKLYRAIDKQKDFSGILKAYDKDTISIEIDDGKELSFDRADIAIIRLAFDF